MCEPATLTLIATGIAVASAGAGAYSSIKQGEYEQAVANRNAQMADQAAADALQRGATEQGAARTKGSLIAGRQQVGLAAAGVDPLQGSAGNILADSRLMSEVDVARIGNNAAREAWGYKVQSLQAYEQGELASMKGTYGAIGSILGGAGAAASGAGSYMRLKEPAPTSPISPRGGGGGDYSSMSGSYQLRSSRNIRPFVNDEYG